MKKLSFLIVAASLLFAAGCDDGEETTPTDDVFSAGAFIVTSNTVNDGCFDGAMTTIVLPDGTPRDFPAAINFPAYSDLPNKIDIKFSAPFTDANGVDVEASGDKGWATSGDGFLQENVSIVADGLDCLANMKASAEMISTDNDHFSGTGTLTITNASGVDCPAFIAGPPCDVTVTMTAVRQ